MYFYLLREKRAKLFSFMFTEYERLKNIEDKKSRDNELNQLPKWLKAQIDAFTTSTK